MVLAEAGIEYDDVHVGPFNPAEQPEAFVALRATNKLPFDTLPLWEETDGFAVVQSDAIVRHIARTRRLYGQSPNESAQCDMVMEGLKDVRLELMKLMGVAPEGRAALRENLEGKILPRWLGYFERWLQRNGGQCFVGQSVTIADIAVYQLLEALVENKLDTPLHTQVALHAFYEHTQARPRLSAWLESPKRCPAQRFPV
jgi:glutathione S-transferase